MKKLTLQYFQNLAESKGGKCLSENYTGIHNKMLWECRHGHRWEAEANSIKYGTWCPYCSNHMKLTIEDIKLIADNNGGKCLSDSYKNIDSKLLWECAKGHRWSTTPYLIKKGNWCPYCAGNIKCTIQDMQILAIEKGGRCLSQEYVNSNTKLLWECALGHKWNATPSHIKRGRWCPECNCGKLVTIEDLQTIAIDRGGRCLSSEYINARTKVHWECKYGHQWAAAPDKIKRGSWCPICSSGLGERICREYFEQLFGYKFPSSYPEWLKSPNGYQLELDGFCQKLGLAFEHQGEQHYSTRTHFVRDEATLEKRRQYDQVKKRLCQANGVCLIEIPELFTRLPLVKLHSHIRNICTKYSRELPSDFDAKNVDLKKAYANDDSLKTLIDLQKIARDNGGNCLSKDYINSSSKLLWECSEGHRWLAPAPYIKAGSWCPHCSNRIKLTIEEMQIIASNRDGKCLSTVYKNSGMHLIWECSKGHQWSATPETIRRGSWCPYCAKRIRCTIVEMQEIAIRKSGKCLSSKYINAFTKLKWECSKGHTWDAVPDSIKRGSWCPICAGKVVITIEDIRALAKQMGGKCLSINYLGNNQKLLWECNQGHKWEAVPGSIKSGTWCPFCAGTKKMTIEDMQKIAAAKEGKCLSGVYINKETKLLWECQYGHRWEAIPGSIKRGSWCPYCAGKR